MSEPMKHMGVPALLLVMSLLLPPPISAQDDDRIQRDIKAQMAESPMLRDAGIEIRVERRLVVLTGEVRLYEQRLIADRIAWTTPGVFEVDNEIRVVPKVPLSDPAIERKIREIIKRYPRFHAAGVTVAVDEGAVFIEGRFLGIGDPAFLKHKVAEIEGVVDIEIRADFLALSLSRAG